MTNFKGTKGKWVKVDYPHCIAVETKLGNGEEHTLFTDQFCYASKFDGDASANALLISKAPEMLEMLENAKQVLIDAGFDVETLIKEATEL